MLQWIICLVFSSGDVSVTACESEFPIKTAFSNYKIKGPSCWNLSSNCVSTTNKLCPIDSRFRLRLAPTRVLMSVCNLHLDWCQIWGFIYSSCFCHTVAFSPFGFLDTVGIRSRAGCSFWCCCEGRTSGTWSPEIADATTSLNTVLPSWNWSFKQTSVCWSRFVSHWKMRKTPSGIWDKRIHRKTNSSSRIKNIKNTCATVIRIPAFNILYNLPLPIPQHRVFSF